MKHENLLNFLKLIQTLCISSKGHKQDHSIKRTVNNKVVIFTFRKYQTKVSNRHQTGIFVTNPPKAITQNSNRLEDVTHQTLQPLSRRLVTVAYRTSPFRSSTTLNHFIATERRTSIMPYIFQHYEVIAIKWKTNGITFH